MIDASQILNASILIVDDQEANVMLLERMLDNAGYTRVTSTMDPFAVGALHLANHYDLILLDLQMPGMDGFEVLEALKSIEPDGYVPVLVVTAQPGHKLRALQAGAKDFVAKPFELVEVETRIHNMLEVRLLYKELAQYSRQQQELALHDPLTGLPNRRLLEDRIATVLQHATRQQNKAAVMYLDLDGFKAINDTHGHATGDDILKMVAQRLVGCARKEDTVARVGGDEFVIVMGNIAHLGDTQEPASKLIEAVSELYLINGLTLQLSTSIGIGIFPDDADAVASVIAMADAALYEAKRSGKNRSCTAQTLRNQPTRQHVRSPAPA